jgi:hypothetical protein
MEEETSVIYKILRLLRGNVIKILIALSQDDNLKWKEIQENTKLPTATLNRSLSALQEIKFIEKKDEGYDLTWAGKLAIEGLILLGLNMGEYPKETQIENFVAEKVLAQNVVLAILIIILASIRVRGNLDLDEFEKDLEKERKVIYRILEDYEKDGYLKIDGKKISATKKFDKLGLDDFISEI